MKYKSGTFKVINIPLCDLGLDSLNEVSFKVHYSKVLTTSNKLIEVEVEIFDIEFRNIDDRKFVNELINIDINKISNKYIIYLNTK